MRYWHSVRWIGLLVWLVTLAVEGVAAEPAVDLLVGEWSKPVTDNRGCAVRGRIVLAERKRAEDLTETIVYVEFQDASEAIGRSIRLYCERHGSDPTRGRLAGWNWKLLDNQQRPVAPSPIAFGGAVPTSGWIELPCDATMRLRVSPWGIARQGGRMITPDLANAIWFIADDDQAEYLLSGQLIFDPEEGRNTVTDPPIWRGTLELPPVKITGRAGKVVPGAR